MIGRLVIRDRALLGAIVLWPGGAIIGYMAAEVLGRAAQDGPIDAFPGPVAFGFAVMWAAMAAINYLSGGGREVASHFHMTLPIRGRELWIARMITLYLPFGGAVAWGFGSFLLFAGEATAQGAAMTAANALAIAAFVPALYHSARVGYAERGMPLMVFIPILLLSLGMYGIWGLGSPVPAGVLGLASLVLLVATYLRVPEAFELAETESAVAKAPLPVVPGVVGRVARLPGVEPVASLYLALRPTRWLTKDQFTLLILLGAAVNVLLLLRSPLSALAAPVIIQVAWLIRTANGAARVDHLPLSRERIFRHAVLPPFVAYLVVAVVVLAWSDTVTWRMVITSGPVAMAALLYVTIWSLSIATVATELAPPNLSGTAWRARFPVLSIWTVLLAVLLFAKSTGGAGQNVVVALTQRLPLSVGQLWTLTGMVLVTGYLLARRQFLRAEVVSLSRGLVA